MSNKNFTPLFSNLNLNPAREENETYKEYVIRRNKCNFILKKYKQVGREVFESVFPEGVTMEAIDGVINDIKEAKEA
tara:strand:+ start:4691 stop:4921 length:231 start_codon:yes stop_codon:yes gene_type:complete